MDDMQDLIARAATFRTLARGFVYPAAGHIQAMIQSLEENRTFTENTPAIPWEDLLSSWRETTEEDLQEEFLRLFQRNPPCPLHETAYGDARRMAGKPRELADISGFYKAFGLTLSESDPDRPDHLATELEFHSLLLMKQAYAISEGWTEQQEVARDATRKFLADHLGRWVNALAKSVAEYGAPGVYPLMTQTVAQAIAAECDRLELVPDQTDGRMEGDEMQAETLICPQAAPVPEEA